MTDLCPKDGYDARWSDAHSIHNDHNRHSYSPCLENENFGSGSSRYMCQLRLCFKGRRIQYPVDVPLHAARETCLANWATACRMLIAGSTGQTLRIDQIRHGYE